MFELTQARVSQICRDVARWHAALGAEPPEETVARRRRLADFDQYHRLRKLYEDTLSELDLSRRPEVERKLGRRGHVEWDEMTYRPPKGRIQLLKLVRNLIHDLHEAEQRVRGLLEEDREAEVAGEQVREGEAAGEGEPVREGLAAREGEAVRDGEAPAEPCSVGEGRQSKLESREGEAPAEPRAAYTTDELHYRPAAPEGQPPADDGHASDEAAEGYDNAPAGNLADDEPFVARRIGVSINGYCDGPRRHRFDYGISDDLQPVMRVLFRGLRAEEEVQDAMSR